MTALTEWANFYMIVGPSAGALIGLQFVVMTLVADREIPASVELGSAFATPSMFISRLWCCWQLLSPLHGFAAATLVWAVVGLAGVTYVVIVARRMQIQKEYKAVFEDWLFHVLLPVAAYAMLAVSAFAARSYMRNALF